ncbi:MAG: hypothetical protein IJN99_01170 [Clostridia bacterium]|nr:hypothetical protein [Clostridia bacterium]
MNIHELLKERNLPDFLSREEMVNLLQENEYGFLPDIEYTMDVSEPKIIERRYVGGKAVHSSVDITITTELGSHTFTVHRLLHKDGKKRPFFIFAGIYDDIPNRYLPGEEIAEQDVDILTFCYTNLTHSDAEPTDKLGAVLLKNGREKPNGSGLIGIWAWATMRVMDYAQTLPELDLNQAAIIGHSRTGKMALVVGMLDERFRYVFSNCSGCSGAAIARGCMGAKGEVGYYETGECISTMLDGAPAWYCKNYMAFKETNVPVGFDQHFLLATIAPRFVYVASAEYDDWADPTSEFLSALAASEYYEKMGYTGLVCEDRLPKAGDVYHEGRIAYHRRDGMHFVSRHDWNDYIAYIKRHMNDEL